MMRTDNYLIKFSGDYKSIVRRNALSITPSTWYMSLDIIFNQAHVKLLQGNASDLQLRITMQPLSNIVSQSTLTGTPIATINSC